MVVGIEAHICVTQTTLDLLAQGHKVYVLADGVSSCNKEEVPVALRRLAREGAVVTTSESWLYECMGDAGIAEYVFICFLSLLGVCTGGGRFGRSRGGFLWSEGLLTNALGGFF